MIARLRQADAAAIVPMLLALLVLLPGITWGLPEGRDVGSTDPWGYDEIAPMGPLIEASGKFRASPKADAYLAYPLFHYLVLAAADAPYLGYQFATGGFRPDSKFPYGMSDPATMLSTLTLIARCVTVLMSLACVWLVYRIGRLMGVERWVASASAMAVALLPLLAYYGHTSNLDVPYCLWTLAALHAAAAVLFQGRFGSWSFIRFGVFSALAIATKDQAYAFLIGLPPLLLIAIARGEYPGRFGRALLHRPLWIGLAASILAFAFANNLVLGRAGFRRHVEQALLMSNDDRVWPSDVAGQIGLLADCAQKLAVAIGPFFVLGLFGATRLARGREWMRFAFLVLPIATHHVLVLSKIGYCHARFMLLPAMLVMLLAACAFQYRPNARGFTSLLIGLAVLGFAWLAFMTFDITRAQLADARYEASRYFAANAKPGQTVETYARFTRLVPRLPEGMKYDYVPASEIGEANLAIREPEYVLITDLSEQRLLHQEKKTFLDELLAGKLGYRVVFKQETPSVFARYFVRGLAPQVTVLQREAPK